MRTFELGRTTTLVVALLLIVTTSGCYSYTYRSRSPAGADLREIAIENYPHEEVRWSSWWGGHQDKWSPVESVKDQSGKAHQVPQCDYGLGQVTVSYTAATFLMTVFTLGIAVPMNVSAWCATEVPPKPGGPRVGP